nr:hypothetical protein [Dyella subtropica]
MGVVTRNVLNQPSTNTLTPVCGRYDQHGEIPVGYAIGNRPGKANDLSIYDSDRCPLRVGQKQRELFSVPHPVSPPVGAEKLSNRFDFLQLDIANKHGIQIGNF